MKKGAAFSAPPSCFIPEQSCQCTNFRNPLSFRAISTRKQASLYALCATRRLFFRYPLLLLNTPPGQSRAEGQRPRSARYLYSPGRRHDRAHADHNTQTGRTPFRNTGAEKRPPGINPSGSSSVCQSSNVVCKSCRSSARSSCFFSASCSAMIFLRLLPLF